MLVALLCWVVVGFIIGVVAGKFVDMRDDDPRIGMIVGVMAAGVGGLAFRLLSHTISTGPGLWSLVTAAGTAVVAVVVLHASRSATRA